MKYTESVEFEWEPQKAESNLRKHGVPFERAIDAFKDPKRVEISDNSMDYGEDRWIVLGRVEETVLIVVFTHRGENISLISARKADRHGQQLYWIGYISS
jgi:uncharacterized DUF497 family protein